MKRLGIDVGGTFTDVILVDPERAAVWTAKVPTTPSQPSQGVINGIRAVLERSGVAAADITFLGHGTTIATNLLVEGKGAPSALITTRGFRDVLEFRRTSRHDRADLYDMFFENPAPLIPRHLRREVTERMDHKGVAKLPLNRAELESELAAIRGQGVEAVAICFLHSYKNPAHELEALAVCRELLPDAFTTASVEVNAEMYEYERTSTTVINAMLGPRCASYLSDLQSEVKQQGLGCSVHLMQSNGGLTTPEQAALRPVSLLESGPAGGVTATAKLCRLMGLANAIAADVGGTTFDVSILRDFEPEVRTSSTVNTYTVRAPTIDIVSVGAGGGSIASVDAAGGLRVGPESAGADPGPASYCRGGTLPTVTDANLVLGFLDPDRLLGGHQLDKAAAEQAITDHVATPLGIGLLEAARMIRTIANEHMAQATRLMTVERGYDPRDFAYVAFGGGGPLHAVEVAQSLGIRKVVVPPYPGLFSAFGMLVADILYDFQAPVMENLKELQPPRLSCILEELEHQARERLRGSNVEDSAIEVQRFADCRYLGQSENITVELPTGATNDTTIDVIGERFAEDHRRAWNFTLDRTVILVNLRVRGIGHIPMNQPALTDLSDGSNRVPPRRIMIGTEFQDVPCYERSDLAPGTRLAGPAVIQEPSTNLIFFSGQTASVDQYGNLTVDLGE